MKKIRIGNDFVFNWAIERGGLPEDLSSVLEKHLHLSVFGKRVELIEGVDYDITGNVIRIEVTPAIANIIGTYKAEFHYILPDNGLIDEDRKCAVDVDAFQIVARTAQADDPSEFTVTSDMAIAFKGDKGDSAYQVWLDAGNTGTEEDYFAYLRQPAIDAGASISELEGEIQVSEGLRVQAESERDLAEATRVQAENERLAAEIIRQSNEGNRIENEDTRVQNEAERISEEGIRQSNEIDRVEAESERVQAESERAQAEVERQITIQEAITATNLANEKANLANTAAQSANEAAGLADTARTELTTAVNAKMGEADDKIEEMDTTLSTYDGRVTQAESDITQLAGEVSLLDAVQGAKIKDIENVLSTANLGQSAQLSVSGRKTISLPKNAANGGMQVKLEGLTAENLVVNGDFRNGTTGWTASASSNTIASGNLLNTGDGTAVQPYIGRNITLTTSNKYYSVVRVRALDAGCTLLRHRVFSTDNTDVNVANPIQNQWYMLSGVRTSINSTLRLSIILHEYVDASTATGKRIEVDYVMFINLTKTFGAGNEPTVEECDAMFSDYFDGVKSFEPTGRVRSVDKNGLNPTALYLTAPELRSNGTVKDEIRKGSNGYELVKRVGVGVVDGAIVPTNATQPAGWALMSGWTLADGVLNCATSISYMNADLYANLIGGKIYKVELTLNATTGNITIGASGEAPYYQNIGGNGVNTFIIKPANNRGAIRIQSGPNGGFYGTISNISVREITVSDGYPIINGGATVIGGITHYTLATPVITPISYGGILNSAENGTVYHEPVIADAGVYDTKIDVLLTDYPISVIEEVIKYENGINTYLDVSKAVVASDGLSFTHPDLADGDLVLFTYAYSKESTNGNITATFYDSNVVKIDTVTGKAYKITDVVTNGILTRTLTEV